MSVQMDVMQCNCLAGLTIIIFGPTYSFFPILEKTVPDKLEGAFKVQECVCVCSLQLKASNALKFSSGSPGMGKGRPVN